MAAIVRLFIKQPYFCRQYVNRCGESFRNLNLYFQNRLINFGNLGVLTRPLSWTDVETVNRVLVGVFFFIIFCIFCIIYILYY